MCPCENKYSKNCNLLDFHLYAAVKFWQNAIFHMDTCKYIHYEVDADDIRKQRIKSSSPEKNSDPSNKKSSINSVLADGENKLVPPQWVQCDLRNLNLSTLGKFTVVMAD